MKRIKALEEILYQDSIENKQKGKKNQGRHNSKDCRASSTRCGGLGNCTCRKPFLNEKVKLRVYMYKRSAKIKM